ncbi:hypothetical protein AC244_33390 [Ensifer adhaerens]|uniref:Uncharacterized protein n=1 Tax=Ensifer adhaerens TaxID=106592 RepID=A0A0L8BDD8_ENSAD|nr:hypothetical protein [Ensifer adhaerens]KOF12623.1 hypothetical protein AC244_33390 [Ensifer adhaerens]
MRDTIARTANAPEYGFMGQPYGADTGLHYVNQARHALFRKYRHDSANCYAFMLTNPSWGFDL